MVVTTKAGEVFEGLMAGSSVASGSTQISLKMTKKSQAADSGQANGASSREAALVGSSPEHAVTFDVRDITDIHIPAFSLPEPPRMANGKSHVQHRDSLLIRTGSAAKFRTDADISGNQSRGERALQPWVPDGPENTNLSLEFGATGDWDQFAANQKLFNTQSTYNENDYTIALDKSSDSYKSREAAAAKKEREILGSQSTNAHMREERGLVAQNDFDDEEAKYSGVRRVDPAFPPLPMGGQNKYTPPARRAPTGQPTIAGAPVDPAIISAQLSRPSSKPNQVAQAPTDKQPIVVEPKSGDANTAAVATEPPQAAAALESQGDASKGEPIIEPTSPQKFASPSGHTEGVETKVLQQFRQFADAEKQKMAEKKRAQASQDRTAKLNDLLRFSKTFKLKTPIPGDLVGILAKDPGKQEAIIDKAKREHEESASAATSPLAPAAAESAARKVDFPQMAAIPDRQTFNRARGGFSQTGGRPDRGIPQSGLFPGRNAGMSQRPSGQQDRKPIQPPNIPAPIPILDGRPPPTGPMADQAPLTSPQRSNLQTPTSATSSSRFNLNVKATEFRPNANAPSFNPSVSSNAPSSPSSVQRTISTSRAASPSAFFGSRKPKPASERPSLTSNFNPIKKMKAEVASRKGGEKRGKPEEGGTPFKDYASNGGIPNAHQTLPRWTVRTENDNKSYLEAFENPAVPMMSPAQSRSGSTHQIPYQNQLPHMPTGPANIPQISTPQHMQHAVSQSYHRQYDDGQPRVHMQISGQVFPSPSIQSRQPSAYASPMSNPAQLAYQQQPYFGAGQMPMQIRQFQGTPAMMHSQGQMAAPMMMQQQTNGPYMQMPQQYTQQMPMYSPNPQPVYPQQNGYGSPSRAPMMMRQGSQQGHHHVQPMMYTMSAQNGPMQYAQPGQMGMVRGYTQQQYGTSPQHGYPIQQGRTMSSGYGQIPHKVMPAHLQGGQGPPMNASQQPAAYAQMDPSQDDTK